MSETFPDESRTVTTTAHEERLRVVMSWVAVILVALFATAVFALVLWRGVEQQAWLTVAKEQFAAVVGLPMVAIAGLFVVLVPQIASGPIEVEIGALKFKGAAAPIVFWLLCFFCIAVAIKMLWIAK